MSSTVVDPVVARKSLSPALKDEASFFFKQTTPRIFVPLLSLALIVRVALGDWSMWDLVVVGALIAAEPFVEWVIHVFILHFKPRPLFGRTIDPLAAKKHREHHRDPRNTEWIFVPLPVLARALPVVGAIYLFAFPTVELGMTAICMSLAILLTYEWTHYLIHSRYQPQSRVYRYIWRAHRLHHFKNEKYWFGVTMHMGDHVLGTFPEKDEVETSPTCKTLGVDVPTVS
jgi:sterol desaturase/sphingolipid hydroxylase (fatty acid hydroxylase superfamily)